MNAKKPISLLFILIMLTGCKSQRSSTVLDNVTFVEHAIKSGELGKDFADRATKESNLNVQMVANPGISYKVFTFCDYQAGYTVIVENEHLILLCAGFGGGFARDFVIKQENNKEVLTYKFDVGSGVSHELSGRYVLGSGHATWDAWGDRDKIKP